jgi:hypothetical protein
MSIHVTFLLLKSYGCFLEWLFLRGRAQGLGCHTPATYRRTGTMCADFVKSM